MSPREITENVRLSAPLARWATLIAAAAVLTWHVAKWKAAQDALLAALVKGQTEQAAQMAEMATGQAEQEAELARLARVVEDTAGQRWDLPHQRVFCARLARTGALQCPDIDAIGRDIDRK